MKNEEVKALFSVGYIKVIADLFIEFPLLGAYTIKNKINHLTFNNH